MITKQKGCKDIYGQQAKKWQYLEDMFAITMSKYNYNYIDLPIFEATELFKRSVGDETDIVQKETYDFLDKGGRQITLRPEGTAGVIRSYLENKMYGEVIQPQKLYYMGKSYRYERPQSGRDREFTQIGVEMLGSNDPMSDAEIISMASNYLKSVGLVDFVIKISTLGDGESLINYKKALVDYFKNDIKNMCEDCQRRIKTNPLRILDCKVDESNDLIKKAPSIMDYLSNDSLKRFEVVKEYLDLLEVNYEVDPLMMRGLDYYNETIFEIEVDVPELGQQNVIGGGGRYNKLTKILDGPEVPGMGFALGLDRILFTLDTMNINIPINNSIDCYIMYVNEEEKKEATYLCQNLRLNGFICETELNARGLKAQFKAGDRLKAKYFIILNSEDLKERKIQVKDNVTKEVIKIDDDKLLEYLELNIG